MTSHRNLPARLSGSKLSATVLIAASGLIIVALYTLFGAEGVLISLAAFIHETSVAASYWLIGLHIAAALYHRFLRDGVWSAMVPIWRE